MSRATVKASSHLPKNVSSGNLQAMLGTAMAANTQAGAVAAAAAGNTSGGGGVPAQQQALPPPSSLVPGTALMPPLVEKPPQSKFGDLAVATSEDYCRVITPETAMTDETEEACAMLVECIELRKKWLFEPLRTAEMRALEPEAAMPSEVNPQPLSYAPLPPVPFSFAMVDGVMQVYSEAAGGPQAGSVFPVPGTAAEFFTSMHRMLRYGALGPVKSFCHHRLMLLEQKFNLHVMLNADKEFLSQKAAPHRDFYNVDTHIHHSACMHQKHLLRFIKSKLRKEPDEVVIFRDGKYLTLKEVFESLNLTGYDLNVDTLDMHADKSLFHRFDRFNLKYNPCGQSRLREIFIKQDNLIHGRFLAEVTQEVFTDLEASKYQHAEMRVSIYGRKAMEWDILASWVVANNLYSDNNVWLIQMLDNIFGPLFEVTQDPASHPQLHVLLAQPPTCCRPPPTDVIQAVAKQIAAATNYTARARKALPVNRRSNIRLLASLARLARPMMPASRFGARAALAGPLRLQVVGFDMVDDESKPERRPTKHCPPPAEWNSKHNCAYSYYAYYIYANLYVLNKFRESRGLNTFAFRPHAGEAGDIDHLAASFMLCENIAHGINLRKSPLLQVWESEGEV
ncbi:hypothetical protein QJQ45_007147 [Haematococcus lacustris]|nr:hypothetical protein QJQ45_007147 [Haematococcus lacustris]